MKKAALFISFVLIFFLLMGAINASELNNVTSTDDSNLIENPLSSVNLEESYLGVSSDNVSYVLNSNVNNEAMQASDATPTDTEISVNTAHYSKSNTLFKIVLQDNAGNPLKDKNITFKFNGKTYSATTGSNGAAYVSVPSQKVGTYTATAKFNGDSEYKKSSFSGQVRVTNSITNRANMVKTYGTEKYFTAVFWKNNSRLADTNVTVTLNGKTYTVQTDSKGVAQISTADLSPGKYTIKLYNPYSKETTSNTITVNKDSPKITANDEYVLPKTQSTYSIILKNGQNKAIKNALIHFTYNNKKVTARTNADGEATITIPALSKGTYTISYKYGGNGKYNAVSGSKKIYVKDSTTTLTASTLKMEFNDGSLFSVKATDSTGKALTNKTINFTLDGKTTAVSTDSNGVAGLAVGNLKPGTYTVKYSYSTAGSPDYNAQTSSIIISQQTVNISSSDLVMKYNDGSSFKVTITNQTGTPIRDLTVKFTLNGNTTTVKTDANGIAKLTITQPMGYYPITTEMVDTTYFTSKKVTNYILVNGTKFRASDMTLPVKTTGTFSVTLLDGQDKPVKSTVKFTLNNKATSVQTDTNGTAKLTISGLAKGTYKVSYTDGKTSGSSTITVTDKIALKEIITASKNVKKYIESNGELPNTVTIAGTTYTTAEYVYLASQAIINLKSNNQSDIDVKSVSGPTNPKEAANLGNLYDYLSVAKSVVNTVNSKGIMPDSVSSAVGTIGYNGLVYATARTVAFYGDNSIMPNYVTIKTYSSSSTSSLNSKNTITNLKPYLEASTNCQVNNSAIKSLVKSLTSGLTTDLAKAKAIYNYVRDSISYSFYYNTNYGAVGTLNAKKGNCVDQAHLLIAMYRTAGLPARYVHGTCKFSSGSTYGHVWTQVLIGDTWIVSDPTSTRNSFGNVVNWNNYNYQLKGYYPSISF